MGIALHEITCTWHKPLRFLDYKWIQWRHPYHLNWSQLSCCMQAYLLSKFGNDYYNGWRIINSQYFITQKHQCAKSLPAQTWIKDNRANHYLFKVNNRNTSRERCKICSKLIKTLTRRQWRRSGVFIVIFEHISPLFLVFLLLNLTK